MLSKGLFPLLLAIAGAAVLGLVLLVFTATRSSANEIKEYPEEYWEEYDIVRKACGVGKSPIEAISCAANIMRNWKPTPSGIQVCKAQKWTGGTHYECAD